MSVCRSQQVEFRWKVASVYCILCFIINLVKLYNLRCRVMDRENDYAIEFMAHSTALLPRIWMCASIAEDAS